MRTTRNAAVNCSVGQIELVFDLQVKASAEQPDVEIVSPLYTGTCGITLVIGQFKDLCIYIRLIAWKTTGKEQYKQRSTGRIMQKIFSSNYKLLCKGNCKNRCAEFTINQSAHLAGQFSLILLAAPPSTPLLLVCGITIVPPTILATANISYI